MGDLFKMPGVVEHLPIVIAILLILGAGGGFAVHRVIKIYRAFAKFVTSTVTEGVTEGIRTHVLDMHSGDEAFRRGDEAFRAEIRAALKEMRSMFLQLQQRIDAHIDRGNVPPPPRAEDDGYDREDPT